MHATRNAELENTETTLRTAPPTLARSVVKAASNRSDPMRSRSRSGTCSTDLIKRRRSLKIDIAVNWPRRNCAKFLDSTEKAPRQMNCHHKISPERSDTNTQI